MTDTYRYLVINGSHSSNMCKLAGVAVSSEEKDKPKRNAAVNATVGNGRSVVTAASTGTSAGTTNDHNDEAFGVLCQRVRDNDPTLVTVSVGNAIGNPTKAAELRQCLLNNDTVHTIVIDLGYVAKQVGDSTAVFGWMDFIQAAPPTLLTVEVQNSKTGPDHDDGFTCTILIVLLLAVSKNPAIKELTFNASSSSPSSSVAKSSAPGMAPATTASIKNKDWNSRFQTLIGRRKRDTMQLRNASIEAFRECHSIDSLWLEHLDDAALGEVLLKIQELPSLKLLVLVPHRYFSYKTSQALSALLTTNQSIQHLELHGVKYSQKLWQCLVKGLVGNSKSVKELSLHDCSFDWAATNCFRSTTFSDPLMGSLRKLTLGRNVRFFWSTASVLSTVLGAITSFTTLDLTDCDLGGVRGLSKLLAPMVLTKDSTQQGEQTGVEPKLESVESSSQSPIEPELTKRCAALESLFLGPINTEEEVLVLQSTIPTMRGLRCLSISRFMADGTANIHKDEMLTAFQTNTTLEKCMLGDEEINLFRYPDQELSIYDKVMQDIHFESSTSS